MRARRIAAEMREWKRIEEERIRLEQLEKERLAREKEAADEISIEESLKYVQFLNTRNRKLEFKYHQIIF